MENEKFEKIEKDEKVETPKKEKPRRTTGQVSCAVLNLREKPSLKANVVNYLERGDKVEILEDQKDWLKVHSEKGNGFVVAEFISDRYMI